ncbi:MAG: glutamate racemase [Actinomycetota bacterium]
MVGDERPIGIFDSGVGGLTVMRAIQELLPQENLIYFGDTARFPFGPRPIEEVRRFTFEIIDFMGKLDSKMLVIACNAMTSAACEEARERTDLPVIGVIRPGARAGVRATRNGKIGVLGTKATIESGQYEKAFGETGERVEVLTQICPAFVERVEAGDTFSEELIALAEGYLQPLLAGGVDTLVLGCTHYPMLRGVLHWVTKGEVLLISSAEEVAKDVYSELVGHDLLRRVKEVGWRRFIVSGDPEEFRRVGSRFLGGLDEVESRPWGSS